MIFKRCFSRETEGDSDVSGENLRSVPDSISESLIALEEDTLFSEVMSENLLTVIKAIRKVRLTYMHRQYKSFISMSCHI